MRRFLAVISLFFFACTAQAYIKTVTQDGLPIHWAGKPKISFYGNTINLSGLSSSDIFSSFVNVMESWKDASQGEFSFDYFQGNDVKNFPNNSTYNQKSSLYFSGMDSNIIGLTQVWYSATTGEIFETDIQLNETNFLFTKNPTDSTSNPAQAPINGKRKVFIDNVLAHEFGHVLGLAHEESLNSSMFYQEFMDQAHLGCEERAGAHSQYHLMSGAGSISGRVLDGSGNPVFAAHVVAVSRSRGTVLATALSSKDGTYVIEGLEPGNYALIVEPYYPGAQQLPSYYSSLQHRVCGGQYFPRKVIQDDSGLRVRQFGVAAAQTTSSGDLVIDCNPGFSGGAMAHSTTLANPLSISASSSESDLMWADRFDNSRSDIYYEVDIQSPNVRLYSLAYGIFSPSAAGVELYTNSGTKVTPTKTLSPEYTSESGFLNNDQAQYFSGLAQGKYIVRVIYKSIFNASYPGGMLEVDSTPYFMLMVAPAPSFPLQSVYADHSKCRKDLAPSTYQSPSNGGSNPKPGGGCGSMQDINSGSGPMGKAVGYFLPFAMMIVGLRFRRKALTLKA